jgi:uncharacterized damage-inducible protein DinB
MPLARLAGLVASMPSWVTLVIEQDELDLTPPPGGGEYQQPSIDQLGGALDQHVAKARESLQKTNDDFLLTTNWRLKAGGQVVMNQPRHVVLRDTLNHLAHHRGQLTVYLRLLGQPVPAIYAFRGRPAVCVDGREPPSHVMRSGRQTLPCWRPGSTARPEEPGNQKAFHRIDA